MMQLSQMNQTKWMKKKSCNLNSVENGVEAMVSDRVEVMTQVREADVDDDMATDMEAFPDIVGGSSETNTVAATQ